MHRSILFASLFFAAIFSHAQKRPLDTLVFSQWADNSIPPKLSPDGRYLVMMRTYDPYNLADSRNVTSLHEIGGTYEKKLDAVYGKIAFSADSRFLAYQSATGNLHIMTLADRQEKTIKGVQSFQLRGNDLYYILSEKPDRLHRYRLKEKSISYELVRQSFLSESLPDAFIAQEMEGKVSLIQLSPEQNRDKVIWTGDTLENLIFDAKAQSYFFKGQSAGKTSFFRFTNGSGAKPIPLQIPENYQNAYQLGQITGLTPDGHNLLYSIEKTAVQSEKKQMENDLLDIRSFQDERLGYFYSGRGGETHPLICMADLISGKSIPLMGPYDEWEGLSNRYAWIYRGKGGGFIQEADWNIFSEKKLETISFVPGRIQVPNTPYITVSPSGNFLLWFDQMSNKLSWMDLRSGKNKSLLEIEIKIARSQSSGEYRPVFANFDQVRWDKAENWLILSDGYDLWKIWLSGHGQPQCLTAHIGARRQMKLFFLLRPEQFDARAQIVIGGVDPKDMSSNFFALHIHDSQPPVPLFRAAAKYAFVDKKARTYLFQVSTAGTSVYYATTKDFKFFQRIIDVHPEKDYNWLRAELHHYTTASGKAAKGVLYKPENFDPQKTYPIILDVYQGLAPQEVHEFRDPRSYPGTLNVPWMVSHGYLVFVAEIQNEYNENGKSALDFINAAKDYVKLLPCVDSNKIGLAGHSFGGYETLYTIGRSSGFAAAYAGSPLAELISAYHLAPGMFHNGQDAIGTTIWEDPTPYFENSAYYRIHHIRTPLLMMANPKDFLSPQGPTFFEGMRRLGKPCWMLEYKGEGHTVQGKPKIDLTLRIQQFFDHYLKGETLPTWMQKESRDKNDPQGTSNGILTKQAQQKADSLKIRKPIVVSFE